MITSRMHLLLASTGMERLLILLDILNIIADTDEYKLLSDTGILGHNAIDTERLSLIFDHILHNFHQEIRLKKLSSIVHMTPTSFCRFFKCRTKRSLSSYLLDVRLDYAAKLLIHNNETVVKIAYESGFNNISNFNKQFRVKFNLSPREYRKLHLG
ncbi:MAG: helix-turn-helix transcriptional regulator [Bacteroidia bacterium]|nr:helix-turn-helix transcriptional regulator [Bacteroidia bacterium]